MRSVFDEKYILLRKYNLELYMTATELTERGVWGGKSISVFSVLSVNSVAESYKKQIKFSIIDEKCIRLEVYLVERTCTL